jgi:hypothetical protein
MARLQVAQLVTVEGGEGSSAFKISAVVIQTSESEVVIQVAGAGLSAEIAPRRVVHLSVTDSSGLHRTEATVTRVLSEPDPAFAIAPPHESRTTQNRNFFRLQTRLAAPYKIIRSRVDAMVAEEDREAFTQDISAGGVRLWTVRHLTVDDRVRVQIAPPQRDEAPPSLARPRPGLAPNEPGAFTLDAQVLRVEQIATAARECYTVGARFMNLPAREQERLVRLMFDLQRRLLHG